MSSVRSFVTLLLTVGAVNGKDASRIATSPAPPVAAAVDSAIERMGGAAALRQVHTVKYEIVSQWLATTLDTRPFQDAPQYELQTEWRDYDARIWRNIRRFPVGDGFSQITDLVADTVAARIGAPSAPGIATPAGIVDGWAPLSMAYIDERREAFAFAPERVLLLARDAADLRAGRDTIIGGIAHAVVYATIDGYPSTVFVRRTDGFLAMVRYRADESNDFGLAPWGPMQVEEWYSRWRYDATSHITYPQQWDIRRVGAPYKRMTVSAVTFNAPLPTDSLVLSASVRASYLAYARRPMADLPFDSARFGAGGRLVIFSTFGAPGTAVKVGRSWLLVEPGNLPLSAERASAWILAHDPGASMLGGVIGGVTPSGGAAWLARQGLPLYIAPAGVASVPLSLRNYGAPVTTTHLVTKGQWVRSAGGDRDSVWIEPIDLPNAPRTLMLYVPSMRWVYSSRIAGPAELARVAARARERGWRVERIGTPASPEGTPPN